MYYNTIIMLVVPVLGAIATSTLERLFSGRTKLIAYYGHISAFELKNTNPPMTVHTHSIIIRNIGEYVDGAVLAILMLNIASPLLDRIRPKALGKGIDYA